ncbi:MAG: murein biosynthesis integral membrane protein MurJ [Acidimicrobiia bacterium]
MGVDGRPTSETGQLEGGLRRATAAMAASTLLSRLTGFGKVLALAYALGLTRLTDAYTLANTTPNMVYELVLGGVLSATLIPIFVERLVKDDADEASEAISAVATVAILAAALLSVLFFVVAPVLVRLYTVRLSGPEAEAQQAVATVLARMFAPQILFYGAITVVGALLHARRRFVAPMITPVLNNLAVIAALVALPHVARDLTLEGIRSNPGALALLGLGTTAGVAVQALALLPALRASGVRLRLRLAMGHPAVRRAAGLSGWTLGYVVANQVTLWAVLVLANRDAGNPAAYQIAYQFFLLPHAVVAVSVMSALLPGLASRWSEGDQPGYWRTLSVGLRSVAALLVPAAVGYLMLARPIVTAVLEHGAFSGAAATTTAGVLALFALGLPFFSAYLLLMRAYQAMQNTRAMFLAYLLENGLNLVLALILYPFLGVAGLALAFSLAYAAGTIAVLADLRRRGGGLDLALLFQTLTRVTLATTVMAAVVAAVRWLVVSPGAEVVVGAGAGLAVYLGVARFTGVAELAGAFRRRS